ncbi:hypothetical protein Tco_0940131 [Tanacetum coccineum]|uniref:Uncharacterized protein n=1 Tax=Tanacetum coccineum TaxID=301880 RepID=A0ABQ5DM44_9ASTR
MADMAHHYFPHMDYQNDIENPFVSSSDVCIMPLHHIDGTVSSLSKRELMSRSAVSYARNERTVMWEVKLVEVEGEWDPGGVNCVVMMRGMAGAVGMSRRAWMPGSVRRGESGRALYRAEGEYG